jgi:hypothetical protein
MMTVPSPGSGLIGAAWVLSDRDNHPGRVADGPLKRQTIAQPMERFQAQSMRRPAGRFERFPLLLKFLNVREMPSVQLHPAEPETARPEAWAAMEAGPDSSTGGTPPVLTRQAWLTVYRGVSQMPASPKRAHPLCYAAGLMVLSKEHPQRTLYRSAHPVLTSSLPQEREATVANVVFPAGIDARADSGGPDRFDIHCGMAGNRIGVARLDLPKHLELNGSADSPGARV